MEKLISVVVPIYNVEKYLRKCLDSILEQTYCNLDIILVDDESPDNCGKIIEEYKKKDQRVRTIHQKNGGLSDARNAGIKIANGEYIIFIDSDDWVEKKMIEILYRNIEKYNSDISICEFIEEDDNGKVLSKKQYNYKFKEFNTFDAIKDLILQNTLTNHAWNKLYKINLFNNVRYPKGQLMEDVSTTYKLIENSSKVVYQNIPLYHYIQRESSILGNITEKRIKDQEFAFFKRNEYLYNKYPELNNIIQLDNLLNVKTLYYLSIMGNYKELYNSEQYKMYYKAYKPLYKSLKNDIKAMNNVSLNMFYINRNLYKTYVKLKKCIKDRI